jgi:AcrR family transcriptional regulator
VSKGQATRQAIVERGMSLASVIGLEGLSIGRLAEELALSKSGLFAHFGSKEALQVSVIEEAARQFVQGVMVPSLREPRGEPRVRALFERWLTWVDRPGGCFFVSASSELDDRPGPARDALARNLKDWLDQIAHAARIAIDEKHFRADLDPHQFAFDCYSIMLGHHLFGRFLRDPKTEARTRDAFEALLAACRLPSRP